jgi:hypothetical protein
VQQGYLAVHLVSHVRAILFLFHSEKKRDEKKTGGMDDEPRPAP